MIYDLWGKAQEKKTYEDCVIEERILDLARNLGDVWSNSKNETISPDYELIDSIAKYGARLLAIDKQCEDFLKDFAHELVDKGYNIREEVEKHKQARLNLLMKEPDND